MRGMTRSYSALAMTLLLLLPVLCASVSANPNDGSHWGPTNVNATYDSSTKSTTITWENPQDSGSSHQIWVWRHSEIATNETWEVLNKSAVQVIFDPTVTSCTKIIEDGIERSVYYSVTYDNGTYSDTRFLSSNTMQTPIAEDTIIPELVGQLTASFDSESHVTSLTWDSGVTSEGLEANIWRSPSPITDTSDSSVIHIATLDGQISNFDHILGVEEFGNYWYAVTLSDQSGNQITEIQPQHPQAGPIFENTVSDINQTVATNVSAEQDRAEMVTISWEDVTMVSNATYHVWASYEGEITQEKMDNNNTHYLGNISAGIGSFTVTIPQDVEREAWYAVTVEGLWGGGQANYDNRMIISSINSILTPIFEDNQAPLEVSNFTASLIEDYLHLEWEHSPSTSHYELWTTTEFSFGPWWNVSEDDGWTLLQTYNATDGTNRDGFVYTGELPVLLALVAVDALGHANHTLYGENPVEVITTSIYPNDDALFNQPPLTTDNQNSVVENSSNNSTSDEVASSNSVVDNVFPILAIALLLFVIISTFTSRVEDDSPTAKVFEEE